MTLNKDCWELSTCSCYKWCKDYKCKHVISLCFRKKCFEYPFAAKNVQISENRKRGRPRLTAASLEYQEEDCIKEYVLSDTESESESPKKRKAKEVKSESDYDIFEDQPVKEPANKKTRVLTRNRKN